MKLLLGLGNYPKEYLKNRHNAGFLFLDYVQQKHLGSEFSLKKDLEGSISQVRMNGEPWILLKPHTYMNLSGSSLGKTMQYYKIDPEDIWVVFDDIDMDFGKIRYRAGGSSGGHNGIKSLIQVLGDQEFHRLKIGVSNEFRSKTPTEKFVLQNFMPEESKELPEIFKRVENLWEEKR